MGKCVCVTYESDLFILEEHFNKNLLKMEIQYEAIYRKTSYYVKFLNKK